MILDATIYVTIAVTAFLMTQLGSDEAAKYIDAQLLFYLKSVTGSLSAGALSLKMFRSETFSNWKKEKLNGNGNGKHETQAPTPAVGG